MYCRRFTMSVCIREVFCPQKTYYPAYFTIGIIFQLTRHFLLVLRTNDCHYPNETATVGSRGIEASSAQASALFCNVAISGETSVIYFLNDQNILEIL